MKQSALLNIAIWIITALSFVSCDGTVTDDVGIVQSIEATSGMTNYGKKYRVEVKIKQKEGYNFTYELYTNYSYRVGDSITIK